MQRSKVGIGCLVISILTGRVVRRDGGPHRNGWSGNRTGRGVALTLVRPRSACKVRPRGLPGSASFRRLRNRSARLQPPRHNAWRPGTGRMPALRSTPIFIAFQRVGNPHERLL